MSTAAASGAKYVYGGLPGWARGTLIVGGAILVVYVGFTIKNAIENAANAKAENAAAETAAAGLAALKAQGIVPSYDVSQYETWSQSIAQAVGGCFADTATINAVFTQMQNQADVLELIAQFGLRNASPCAASTPLSYIEYMFNNKAFGGSLPYLLTWGLSASDLKGVNAILTGKGIPYQF